MKITFLSTHSQRNWGDELLLETFLTHLGKKHSYAVNTDQPELAQKKLEKRFRIETFYCPRQTWQMVKHILTSDLLFLGGNHAIRELPASTRQNRYAALWMLTIATLLAKFITRKKIIMSNIGIDPLRTPLGQSLAKGILKRADFVSVCDKRSLRICQEMGVKAKIMPDAIFTNAAEKLTPIPQQSYPASTVHLALNLSHELTKRPNHVSFLENLADALLRLNALMPLTVHTLPCEKNDLTVLEPFLKRISAIPTVSYDVKNAQDAGEIIARCDLVLAQNYSALAISAILGKPFFGLVDEAKSYNLIHRLGMERHSLNILQPFETNTLRDEIQNLWRNRQSMQEHLNKRSAELRAELTNYFAKLRLLIEKIPERPTLKTPRRVDA